MDSSISAGHEHPASRSHQRGAAAGVTPGTPSIALAYVSLVVPQRPEFDNPALHRTGNSFMLNFLRQLTAGFPDTTSFSALPVPSFPRTRRFVISGGIVELDQVLRTELVPFVNVTPLKQLSIGAAILAKLVAWGRRHADARRLIFCYNTSVPHIAFSLLAARLTGSTLVAFIGDVYVPGQTAPDTGWYRADFALQKRLIRQLDGLVVVSDRIANDFAPGCDFLRLDAALDDMVVRSTGAKLGAGGGPSRNDTVTLVHSGGLIEHNGTTTILEAFTRLDDPRLRLRVAGRGPLTDAVLSAARRDPRIEFLGYLAYEDLLEVHASADILISFRVTEGMETGYAFPSKTMEYLCSGVPVITTKTGHMEAEYGPYCYLVEEESPEGLARTIRHVLERPREERQRRARLARDYVIATKTWDAQGMRLRQYLRCVMERCRTGGTR